MKNRKTKLSALLAAVLVAGTVSTTRINVYAEDDPTSDTPAETAPETPVTDTDEDTDEPTEEVKTYGMYRLYNPNTGEHFYTRSSNERDWLVPKGWRYEGIAWKAPAESGTPVYRLYNPNTGDHHYTPSEAERDWLVPKGWRYEGISWNSDNNQTIPIYRLYNPNSWTAIHHYTASESERDHLVSLGWCDEGVGWYGAAAGDAGEVDPSEIQTHYNYGKPPVYMQTDSRWAYNVYNGYTMRDTGCGICSISMVVSDITGQQILPPTMANYLLSINEYNPGRSRSDVWPMGNTGMSNIYGAQYYGVKCDKIGSYEQMIEALKAGKLVTVIVQSGLFYTGSGSHEVVLYSYNAVNNTVWAVDPLFSYNDTRAFDARAVWNNQATNPLDRDAGVTMFAFYK